MLFWNPLYEVALHDDAISMRDEQAHVSLQRPTNLDHWALLRKLEQGISLSDVTSASSVERRLLDLLVERMLVIELPEPPFIADIDRNLGHFLTLTSHPRQALTRLRSSTVCILGVGGVGLIVLQHLAAAGVRRYVLVDNDRVESSNLNRQFVFSNRDVGRMKVDVCHEYLTSRLDDVEVVASTASVDSTRCLDRLPLERCDIIAHCLDTPRPVIDDIVYEYGAAQGITVATAGVGVRYGHWGPLISPVGGLTFHQWKTEHLPSDKTFTAKSKGPGPTPWSFGPTNTIIAAHLARDIIEWLSGCHRVNSLNARLVKRFADNHIFVYGDNRDTSAGAGFCRA